MIIAENTRTLLQLTISFKKVMTMDMKKAIEKRRSKRKYIDIPLDEEMIFMLRRSMETYNREAGVDIRMVLGDEGAFGTAIGGIKKSYGLFSGVKNYFILVSKLNREGHFDPLMYEKLGYYGEKLVLEATAMGLGTCWVGGTYDKEAVVCSLQRDEEIASLIAFGAAADKMPISEQIVGKAIHYRRSKEVKDMLRTSGDVENWIIEGMRCVVKAPSAMNMQPVIFTASDDMVSAKVRGKRAMEFFDLGIAKLHFEIGVGGGRWDFGNGAVFQPPEE